MSNINLLLCVGYHANADVRSDLKTFLESQSPGTIIAGVTAYEPVKNLHNDNVGVALETLLIPYWTLTDW